MKSVSDRICRRLKLGWTQLHFKKYADKLCSKDYNSKKFAKLAQKVPRYDPRSSTRCRSSPTL